MRDEADCLVFTRRVYIGAPAEIVWEWLVDPEKSRLYSLSELEQRATAAGDPVRYRSKLGGHPVIEGVVEELVEGRRLVHTFQLQVEPLEAPSRVSYELLRFGDRMCCLALEHTGIELGGHTWDSIAASWDIQLSSLKTLIETGAPLPWPSRH